VRRKTLFSFHDSLFADKCIHLLAAWISLQFPWIHELAPDLVMLPRACERTVFSGLPFPAAALLTWALSPITGADAAPFVFTGLLFFNYAVCVLPMASSFTASPPKNAAKVALDEPDSVVLSRFDTGLNTVAMIVRNRKLQKPVLNLF
jgi:hypothetical protein